MITLSSGEQTDLLKQVELESRISNEFIQPKWKDWTDRLKMYNNQIRDPKYCADPLMYTLFQTLFAAFHSDRYDVTFEAREQGDEEVAENLNRMAEYDYDLMNKAAIDREWVWDTLFFGRGLCLFMNFDREHQVPVSQVIDPLAFMRDPQAESVNGDFYGAGSARFLGSQLRLTHLELQRGKYTNVDQVVTASSDNEIDENIKLRKQAQGLTEDTLGSVGGDNTDYRITRWFTWFQGKRVMVETANNNAVIINFKLLKQQDRWPIIDKIFSPIAHSWDGVAVPDLTESQQRHRAVIMNAAMAMVKDQVAPLYMYDSTRVKHPAYLNRSAGKHIPIDGPPQGAVDIVPKDQVRADAQWILDMMDSSTQRALASSEIQQGVISETRRTATELALVQQKSDTRYTLALKVMGEAERTFWNQWYNLYKINFKDGIDKKIVRLTGALSSEWRPLTRENIIAKMDPDVTVENRILSEQKRFAELQAFSAFISQASQDPTFNRRAAMRQQARRLGMKYDEIQVVFPPTSDEILAQQNVALLNDDKLPQVSMSMDPAIHLEFVKKANDTKARRAYEKMLMALMVVQQIKQQQMQQQMQQQQLAQAQSAQPAAPQEMPTNQSVNDFTNVQ